MITIYNFQRGGRGVRLCWQCEEMGLAYDTKVVTYPPSAEYMALNPLGSVPFLVDGDVKINESVAIMLYLAEHYGPTPLLPDRKDPALARVFQMLVFSEASFGANMNDLLAARFGAPEEHKKNWSVGVAEMKADAFLKYIEGALGDQEYLGGKFSLADIAVATGLGIYRGALQRTLSPKLTAYHARLADRPQYQRAQKRQAG